LFISDSVTGIVCQYLQIGCSNLAQILNSGFVVPMILIGHDKCRGVLSITIMPQPDNCVEDGEIESLPTFELSIAAVANESEVEISVCYSHADDIWNWLCGEKSFRVSPESPFLSHYASKLAEELYPGGMPPLDRAAAALLRRLRDGLLECTDWPH
jgi:hypothetical protein